MLMKWKWDSPSLGGNIKSNRRMKYKIRKKISWFLRATNQIAFWYSFIFTWANHREIYFCLTYFFITNFVLLFLVSLLINISNELWPKFHCIIKEKSHWIKNKFLCLEPNPSPSETSSQNLTSQEHKLTNKSKSCLGIS